MERENPDAAPQSRLEIAKLQRCTADCRGLLKSLSICPLRRLQQTGQSAVHLLPWIWAKACPTISHSDLESLQPDVPKLYFHRRAYVHLESDQSAHRAVRRVVVNRGGHQTTVQNVRERIPTGDDVEMIPIVGLDQTLEVVAAQIGDGLLFTLLQERHLAAQGEEAAPALLIKLPRIHVLEIDVGLIAFHHPFANLGKFYAAVLHSAVGRVDAVFQFKLEILGLAAAPNQKCVVPLQRLFRRALADDGFVLHAPENGIAVPSLQALAVEDGFKSR